MTKLEALGVIVICWFSFWSLYGLGASAAVVSQRKIMQLNDPTPAICVYLMSVCVGMLLRYWWKNRK
jgi:hypothetical protein